MNMLRTLRRNQTGAAAVEFALIVPILILMIWGIFQVGIAFHASAGMQHALGEGARFATIFPRPDNDQIVARINSKVFGTGIGEFSTPSVTTPDPATCTDCTLLSVSFRMTPNFLFFNGPEISLNREKLVYVANALPPE
ncbi:MAG: TadE/TadG family type IV pilus assembly protein [Pseudomonadota bacterium]